MKKYFKLYSFLLLAGVMLLAACSDDDEMPDPNGNGTEERIPVLPENLRVERLADVSAILTWDGTSSEYEVEWGGETLSTRSISYGLEGLEPATTYSWKVRSKEGEHYSEWVAAENFTTLEVIDYTKGWTGKWMGSNFTAALRVLGSELPVESFFPDEVLKQDIEVSIAKKEGLLDGVVLSSDRLQEISNKFPREVEGAIKNDRLLVLSDVTDTLRYEADYPLSLEDLPADMKDIVTRVIEGLPFIGELVGDLQVKELGIILDGLNLTGRWIADNKMLMKFSVTGKLHLNTTSELANVALKLLALNVSFDATVTLSLKE